MALANRESQLGTLLVYLPCYLDYELSLRQAKKIREIFKESKLRPNFSIKTMISINGLNLTSEQLREVKALTDYQVIFPFGISGDINITQGFMHAIRLKADYLWILSSNDAVASTFVEAFQRHLLEKPEADLLVGCTSNNLGVRKVASVFDPENQEIPFGLISAVIYRTARTSNNFDSAVQLNWTGWGQLATIEASCISRNGLTVSVIEEKTLYTRSIRGLDDSKKESERIRNGYAHSFFGMPILINSLLAGDPKRQNRLLNEWVRSNWYLVNYFLNTDFKLWNAHLASNQSWLRAYANAAIGNASPRYRILFLASKRLNLARFQNWAVAKWLRARLQKRV
jgi:hypothetical protein